MSTDFGLIVEPGCGRWRELIAGRPEGGWRDRTLAEWRQRTRGELGVATDRPVIATGHQTLLWHPGILVKYLAVQAMTAAETSHAAAHLIVDQHVGAFGTFDVPVRRDDGALALAPVMLTEERADVPMGEHPAFTPTQPVLPHPAALPSVQEGLDKIVAAVAAHARAPNAALQMAAALGDLMAPWVGPWPGVCSSDLMKTSLAETLLSEMARDPRRCAACYNAAVKAVPGSGIGPLSITDQRVELPLWRLGPDGRRQHADDGDARRWLEERDDELLPRALLLTLLVRLGMCDLFVHGTGGATYDRAMETWLMNWLGLRAAPVAVVTATLRLPLDDGNETSRSPQAARLMARRIWHDPESAGDTPSRVKKELLAAIDAAPRRSRERYQAFLQLHDRLEVLRHEHREAVETAQRRLELALVNDPITRRRDWPFPLYPAEMISGLAETVDRCVAESP